MSGPGRNAVGGNTAAAVRRSTTMNTPTSAAPAASSAAVHRHVVRDAGDADRQRRRPEQQQRPHRDPVPHGRDARGAAQAARTAPAPRCAAVRTPAHRMPNATNRIARTVRRPPGPAACRPPTSPTRARTPSSTRLRQRRIDDRVAQPREQSARRALHCPARQQELHRGCHRAQQAAETEHAQARQVGPPRSEPRKRRAHGGGRHHRGDQVHGGDPRVEPLTADFGDGAGQQADRQELVGRIQRHAAGEHRGGTEVLRAQQLAPAAAWPSSRSASRRPR